MSGSSGVRVGSGLAPEATGHQPGELPVASRDFADPCDLVGSYSVKEMIGIWQQKGPESACPNRLLAPDSSAVGKRSPLSCASETKAADSPNPPAVVYDRDKGGSSLDILERAEVRAAADLKPVYCEGWVGPNRPPASCVAVVEQAGHAEQSYTSILQGDQSLSCARLPPGPVSLEQSQGDLL